MNAFSLDSVAATAIAVPLVPRLGRYLVTIDAAFMTTGFLWALMIIGAEGGSFTAWAAVVPMLLAGVGLSAIVIPLGDVALATVPIDDAGAASGVLTTSQQLGAAVGVAVSMTVVSAVPDDDWIRAQALRRPQSICHRSRHRTESRRSSQLRTARSPRSAPTATRPQPRNRVGLLRDGTGIRRRGW